MAPPSACVKFLGTCTTPIATRNYSSDCGEGTQRQLFTAHVHSETKLSHIRTILITHLHPDHILGLVPMMFTMMGLSAETPKTDGPRLQIIGPLGLRAHLRSTLSITYATLNSYFVVHELLWPSQPAYPHEPDGRSTFTYTEQDLSLPEHVRGQVRTLPIMPPHANELPGKDIRLDEATYTWTDILQVESITISAAPITHRCPTVGYVLQEAMSASKGLSPRELAILDSNTEALFEQQNIRNPRILLKKLLQERKPLELPDGNTLYPPVLDRPGRKICILGDTCDATSGWASKGMVPLAQDADLVVHECTYTSMSEDDVQVARQKWFHVMREIERQVTKYWHEALTPEVRERVQTRRAIAAYDGLSVTIPPREVP
ncbi:metallo-hydrolase oxidoreductase [Malassezia pachydermatis]|uniref:Metallo-hydrolase oxidoreductase n=1 Tax=Malassezia pachydermatis TaxID=77020 RepID=A0A0M8MJI8_9BASI|nr:metallo-hydrolase oxidoreductase [Malassezia pachydermatis]KOS12818.1 metallo-hydrolase oxidoreductase [Malassezia pachydermatis]